MIIRQNLYEQINQCVDAMNNIFYVQESAIFPKYNGEVESNRVAAVTKNVSIRELTCRKAECFHEFCRVFEFVIRQIINNLEKFMLPYKDDRDFDIDEFMSSYVNPLNEKFQSCSCQFVAEFIEDYLKNKKNIEQLKQEYSISKFYNRTVICGREDEGGQWGAYGDFLNKFIKRYVFNYVEKCEGFTKNWHKGYHNVCQDGNCPYAHSILISNIYATTRSKCNNLCVLDEKAGFCFSDLRVIKKHLNGQYGLKYLLKYGSDNFVRYYIDSRIRPIAVSHTILPQMPYFAQVGKEILAYYLATEMKENLTADNHNNIKTKISWLYNDISLALDNPIPKSLLLSRLYSSTYFGGVIYNTKILYHLNSYVNLFNVLYTLTDRNMDIFNKFAAFIASVYAGRKIKSSLLDKQDKITSSVYIFVTPNRTFVEEFLRDIFIPCPKQTHITSQGKTYEFDEYKHSLDGDNHVLVHHYTEYSLEQLCDKRYIGKFIEDQFYGHMLNVTSLNNNLDEDTLIKFNKLASGEVIEGENTYLGTQKYISNITYAFILSPDKSFENLKNKINTFEKCVPGVHLIILDDNISPQIHLINKDEFNPINRSMFNNEEKLYMATKMVEYGYHVHKFGTQYKECRTEDIIKRFLDTCGRFVDVPEGEENEVLSTENATTISAFNEAFSNFYNEIKQVPFSKKFDKNNFEDYFKDTNCKLSNHDNFKIPNLYGRDKKNLEIVKGYEGAKDKGRYVKGFVVEPLSKVKEAAIAYAEEIKNSVQEPEVLSDYNFVEELVRMLDNDEIYQKFFNEFGCLDINSPLPPNFKEVTGGNSQYSNADGEKIMFSKQFFNL